MKSNVFGEPARAVRSESGLFDYDGSQRAADR